MNIGDWIIGGFFYIAVEIGLFCGCHINSNPVLPFTYNLVIRELYDRTEMNWFGCFICTCLLYAIFPIPYFGALIIKIIYWITHIGRKSK